MEDIGFAVAAMELGYRVRREGWRPPRDWWVAIAFPADGRTVTDWPFFIKHWSDGTVAWAPTHADLLAKDWEIVGGVGGDVAPLGAAVGELDDTDMTKADIDQAMETGTPVQTEPPPKTERPVRGWGGVRG